MATALLTAAEAADRLRVSARTLQRLHQRRALPYVRIAGQIRFPADALDHWIAQQTVYPEAEPPQPKSGACSGKKEAPTGGSNTGTPAGERLKNLLRLPTAPRPR